MKEFGGLVLFIDRDNINTDEIIPAKYLTEIEKEPLKEHLLEDLILEGFDTTKIDLVRYSAVVSRANFGCGSSREMAPWAFEVNGINVIIASNFARIFRENTFNCGMLAIELDPKEIDALFNKFSEKEDVQLSVNLEQMSLSFKSSNIEHTSKFIINQFQKDLVLGGGWVQLANSKY